MYANWLKHAHPGLPRTVAWVLAWLLYPLVLLVTIPLELAIHGVAEAGELFDAVNYSTGWLWRQRTTFDLDPWKQAR